MASEVQNWIDFINGEVAIFMPYADRLSILGKLPSGRYELSDRSYRFPLSDAKRIIDSLPPGFQFSDEFLEALEVIDAGKIETEVLPVLRVDLIADAEPYEQIALYLPYDYISAPYGQNPTILGIMNLKAHYVSDDRSWRFALSQLKQVVQAFPEPTYHYSDAFKKACKSRVDLLLDEHPNRCIAVVDSGNDSYFKRKVTDLGGVYNESDSTWRFNLNVIDLILVYFPSPDYSHSEAFLNEFKPIDCGF